MVKSIANMMALHISTPGTIGSTSLPKRSLSYRWVINDAQVFLKNATAGFRSPKFEVNLSLRESSQKVSKWQLVIKKNASSFSLFLCYAKNTTLCDQFAYPQQGRIDLPKAFPKPTQTIATGQVLSSQLPPGSRPRPSMVSSLGSTASKILIFDCTFSILDSSTNKVKHSVTVATRECVVGVQMEDFGVANFIKQDELTKYLDGHTLTLQVDATLLCLTDNSECVETSNTLVPADNIREDLGSFCQGDLFADVTITCGGKEFRAHKLILASQSPVFKKMFEIDMKERRSGVIEAPDITPAVMSDLLAYLYTGTAPHVDTLVRELLNVANKYELPRLLSICETTLVSKITADSVFEILTFAELHQAKTLKKACLGFIKCNFTSICELDSWKDMKTTNSPIHQILVCEILEYYHHSL